MKLDFDIESFLRPASGYWYLSTPFTNFPGGNDLAFQQACKIRGELLMRGVSCYSPYTIMDSLPFPRDWRRTPGAEAIITRSFALSAVGLEMEEFRRSAPNSPGVPQGIAPTENPDIRAQLMAEIDALVAHEVFGLTRDELRYVLDPDNLLGEESGVETFKALRNREKRQLGEYRTQRLVLEAWDRFKRDGTFGSPNSRH